MDERSKHEQIVTKCQALFEAKKITAALFSKINLNLANKPEFWINCALLIEDETDFIDYLKVIETDSVRTPQSNPRKTFAEHGIPPPSTKQFGSGSDTSINNSHQIANFVERPFSIISDIKLDGGELLWTRFKSRNSLTTSYTESSIHNLVHDALDDAIVALGLGSELECFNELSIFRLRADIWIVVTKTGVPIGVAEVKKPSHNTDVLNHPHVHGQIFDYMLRLKNFHGLRYVFGIVSTYHQWRFYWLPDCDEIANSTTTTSNVGKYEPNTQDIEVDFVDDVDETDQIKTEVIKEREVHGSQLIEWNDPKFSKLLGSIILKMQHSPIQTVSTFDKKRAYIVMNKTQWYWSTLQIAHKFRLKTGILPKARELIFLHDFRGGADGRVWLTCSRAGLACVVKFAQRSTDINRLESPEELKKKLEIESLNWKQVWNLETKVMLLGDEYALIMPYIKPVIEKQQSVKDIKDDIKLLVKDAIYRMAKQGYCHLDLKWEHVGLISPTKKNTKPVAYFSDMKQISRMDEGKAVFEMFKKLNL